LNPRIWKNRREKNRKEKEKEKEKGKGERTGCALAC
jgi:hypothetical protein